MIQTLINLTPNKPLSSLSTLGIGGLAKLYTEVNCIEEMQAAIHHCATEEIHFLVIGKGSNCLFDDRGFNGCIILNKINFFNHSEGLFHVGGGYSFSHFGTISARLGYGGMEFASGIPASIGGAVFMNAGANGSETKDHLESVDFVDHKGDLIKFLKKEIAFDYRLSSFQNMKGAIVGATFLLQKNDAAREKQMKIIHKRQKTQPYREKSAGCIFRNLPHLPAGQLIDKCGLKGFSLGNASVSDLHANFLINKGAATSADFKELIRQIQKIVYEKTGLHLECEVRMVPYEL